MNSQDVASGKNSAKSLLIVLVLVVLLAVVTGYTVHIRNQRLRSDQIVLKLAHGLPTDHVVHKAMQYMADRMKQESHGKVIIKIYPSEQLGNETACIELLQLGAIDITKTSAAALENFSNEMKVFGLPYIFRDEKHYWKVLKGPIGQELLLKLRAKGMRGLCYYDSGSRNFYTTGNAIISPKDLNGKKIRVMNSPMAIKMIKAMGGNPTPISWGELYGALQQGVVDGAENNPPSLYTSKQYEVCKHFTLDGHTMIPDVLIASEKRFKKLPVKYQKMLIKVAKESRDWQIIQWRKQTLHSLKEIQKAGVQIHRPDKKPFMDKVKPLYDEIRKDQPVVGKYLDKIIKQ